MTNELIKFEYNKKEINTLTDEKKETWFVAKEICDILELSNSRQSVQKLDDDEKLMYKLYTSGQPRDTWCINESGLYHLILTSTKPEAKAFRKWVTGVVLPSIRKSGVYSTEEAQEREDSIQDLVAVIERIENEIGDLKLAVSEKKKLQEQKEAELRQLLKTDFRQYKLQFPKNED